MEEEEAAQANGVVEAQVEELVEELRNSSLAASPPHSPGEWVDLLTYCWVFVDLLTYCCVLVGGPAGLYAVC